MLPIIRKPLIPLLPNPRKINRNILFISSGYGIGNILKPAVFQGTDGKLMGKERVGFFFRADGVYGQGEGAVTVFLAGDDVGVQGGIGVGIGALRSSSQEAAFFSWGAVMLKKGRITASNSLLGI